MQSISEVNRFKRYLEDSSTPALIDLLIKYHRENARGYIPYVLEELTNRFAWWDRMYHNDVETSRESEEKARQT